MAYRVIITPDAKRDLRNASNYIRRDSRSAAERWLKQMHGSIQKLSKHPERCPMAPEAHTFERPIRELLCGSGNRGTYRALYTIVDNIVYVFHVRHGSMLPLAPEE